MKYLDWNPEKDNQLKKKEIEIHQKFHDHLAEKELSIDEILGSSKRIERSSSLKKALSKKHLSLSNKKVLELGAGDGWCSLFMLKNFELEELHAMEINDAAVHSLIPKVLELSGKDLSHCTVIKGSFNNIENKEYYDYIIAMGALHHSSNLHKTFSEIWSALKPGGWLIAQEPFMPDFTTNDYYYQREDQNVDFKNLLKVKNNERSDLFYRLCEYQVAAYHAGFNFYYERMKTWPTFRSLVMMLKNGIPKGPRPGNLSLVCQKPEHEVKLPTPTGWE